MITKHDIYIQLVAARRDDAQVCVEFTTSSLENTLSSIWFDANKTQSTRLTMFGKNVLANTLKLKYGEFAYSPHFNFTSDHLLTLTRKMKSPYYTGYVRHRYFTVFGEDAISEFGLFGDIEAYLGFLKNQT